MKIRAVGARLLTVLALAGIAPQVHAQKAHDHEHGRKESDIIENKGQWGTQLDAYAGFSNGGVYFEPDVLHFDVDNQQELATVAARVHAVKSTEEADAIWSTVMHKHYYQVRLVGANAAAQPELKEKKKNIYNFFLGEQANWRSNVGAFHELHYNGIYPGIDVQYKLSGTDLKYDFIVGARADADAIRMAYTAVNDVRLENGQLVIVTSVGEQREYIPMAYQDINGKRLIVPCEYRLSGNTVSFAFPEGYNQRFPLVIDPQLIASTNSGSTAMIFGHTATYDNLGNIFVGGNGFGPGGLPITPGAYQATFGGGNDMALNKYNPDGTQLLFSTYLGGNAQDLPHSMITGPNGDLYVLGSTSSTNFPVTTGAAQTGLGGMTDIAISHFSADGTSMVGSTYFGGTDVDGTNNIYSNYGDSYRGEINLAANGDVLIASFSQSTAFPTTTGAFQTTAGGGQDAVVARLAGNLSSVVFATLFGGNSSDAAYGILEAPDGTIYVSGSVGTDVFNFPGSPAQPNFSNSTNEAVALRFAANGQSLVNGTYLGNYGDSQGFFIQLNPDDKPLVLVQSMNGVSATTGKYTYGGNQTSIIQYTADFATLEWVSAVDRMAPSAFLVDNCGRIYVSGHGLSGPNYETTPDAIYNTPMGFYLFCLDESATTLLYGTHYGNGGSHVDGGTSRFDANGVVYQGTCSGGAFPAGPNGNYSDNNNGGSYDMTVFKIDFEQAPAPFTLPGQTIIVCDSLPQDVTFTGAPGNVIHHWWFHDGTTSSDQDPVHAYTEYGDFEVMYYPELIEGCLIADTITAIVHMIEPEPFIPTYSLLRGPTCDDTLFLTVDFTGIADSVSWDFGDGFITNNQDTFMHFYAVPGTYNVTFYAEDSVCNQDTTFTFPLTHDAQQGAGELFMPNVFTGNDDGVNDTYQISSPTHSMAEVFESLEYYDIKILNRWGNTVFESTPNDPQTWPWDGKTAGKFLEEGVYFYLVEYKGTCIEGVQNKHGFVHVIKR